MNDALGRSITYLRLSVTELCNLRCGYCMPPEGVCKRTHGEMCSFEELCEFVRAAAALGVTKLRLTGGEPLVRRGITELCAMLREIPGIRELCLTTNGTLLPQYALPLRRAGLDRLNISLDTLRPDRYREITRGGGRGVCASQAQLCASGRRERRRDRGFRAPDGGKAVAGTLHRADAHGRVRRLAAGALPAGGNRA